MGLTLQHPTSGGLGVAHGLHHRGGAMGQVGGQAGHAMPPVTTRLPGAVNRSVCPSLQHIARDNFSSGCTSFQGGLVLLPLTSHFPLGKGSRLCDKSLAFSNLPVSLDFLLSTSRLIVSPGLYFGKAIAPWPSILFQVKPDTATLVGILCNKPDFPSHLS